jgi:hypothetical protein
MDDDAGDGVAATSTITVEPWAVELPPDGVDEAVDVETGGSALRIPPTQPVTSMVTFIVDSTSESLMASA